MTIPKFASASQTFLISKYSNTMEKLLQCNSNILKVVFTLTVSTDREKLNSLPT